MSDIPSKNEFLLLLLSEIETNGANITKLAENLKWSKQRVNYHLNHKLNYAGIVKKTQSYPFAIYTLTPFGEQVKKYLIHSEGVSLKPLWRVHNLILGFDIKDFGNFSFEGKKTVQMKNWYYFKETIKDSIGIWNINIQSTGLLKIYAPAKYGENPDTEFGILERIGTNLAEKYSETYNMKLGLLKQIREGEKELVRSEELANLFGRFRLNDIFVNASGGTNDLEEPRYSVKIEDMLAIPSILKQLLEVDTRFSKNLELHLEVLTKMSIALDKIVEKIDKL